MKYFKSHNFGQIILLFTNFITQNLHQYYKFDNIQEEIHLHKYFIVLVS